ncbi:MAG: adenylosuccinate synthase [Candidatus Diapherotrites archaeon]|nr:adenylosuccinate synthase [Candidatus Diapherotrites archaeon]
MPAIVVVGAQFGDEGKGKIVDLLAEKADFVVRYNGGNNAGHTVVVKGKKYKFHLLPSGAIQGKTCCIGAGVALDPRVLKEELLQLGGKKILLMIDPRVQVIMPWHNFLDAVAEDVKGKEKIGTTGRGIGPCYADRADRSGIRFCEIVEEKRLRERVEAVFPLKEKILHAVYNSATDSLDKEKIIAEYSALGKEFAGFLQDVSAVASEALEKKNLVLFEGAQGTFLDNDFGTYPFVTSSHPIAGSIFTGVGLGLRKIERVIGVAKAYATRVGGGPFVTELHGALADKIREKGAEFGTTTGRPRRVGWLDLPMLRTAHRLNGFTEIALTKIDVLAGLDEVKVCIAYQNNGEKVKELPADMRCLGDCTPVYKKFGGFEISGKEKSFAQLPKEAKDYIAFIEKELGVPVGIVSVGAEREETIIR